MTKKKTSKKVARKKATKRTVKRTHTVTQAAADPFAGAQQNVQSAANFAIGANVAVGTVGIVSGMMGALKKP